MNREPPYYAVIFASTRTGGDLGYAAMAARMMELAAARPGYLGADSVRDAEGRGITVSYWSSLEDIESWRIDSEHLAAQRMGRETWYKEYSLRVARVERASEWTRP